MTEDGYVHRGWVRIVAEKTAEQAGDASGIDVHYHEAVQNGFAMGELWAPDWVNDEVSELAVWKAADVLKKQPPGSYEIFGEFWWFYDSGVLSPEGQADPDSDWQIRSEMVKPLTEKQMKVFKPDPLPPPPREQDWEHQTSETELSRYHHQCPQCKRWCHRCSNCGWMSWAEDTYCSENCWIAAGKPEEPKDAA